jgi:hypothetical protein
MSQTQMTRAPPAHHRGRLSAQKHFIYETAETLSWS